VGGHEGRRAHTIGLEDLGVVVGQAPNGHGCSPYGYAGSGQPGPDRAPRPPQDVANKGTRVGRRTPTGAPRARADGQGHGTGAQARSGETLER
jgi:hypothetical protein